MDRRRFLSLLGLGAAGVVAPTKAYSFLGGILRPRKPESTEVFLINSNNTLGVMWLEAFNSVIGKWEKLEAASMGPGAVCVFKHVPTDSRYLRMHYEPSGPATGRFSAWIDHSPIT